MKFDLLHPFNDYLNQNLTKNTARKYYSSVVKILKEKQFSDIQEIDKSFIESELLKFKTKNDFSAAKNGLLHLKKFYPKLDIPDDDFFSVNSKKKRNWSKKPKKNIYLDTVKRKINKVSNPKLKLAYRLALISGLRVSELEALEKRDIHFEDGRILVDVRHGKGGSNGTVKCLNDNYVFENLGLFINGLEENDRLFYSEEYMREKANDLGLECHDLRRICAITYRNQLKEEMPVFEANKKVQDMLRHKRFSTTKRYLFNKKLVIKKKGE